MSDELDLKHMSAEFRALVTKHKKRVVTWDSLAVVLDFVKAMNLRNAERNTRLDILEQRIRELENTSMKHYGVWQPDRSYPRGSVVTLKGSWWLAKATTSARPGDPDEAARAWELTVKRGTT